MLGCFIITLLCQAPAGGEEYAYVSSTGFEVICQRLTEEQKAHALDNLEGVNRFIVDEYIDFQIQGNKLYIDAEGLETEKILIIVSPKDNPREVLEIEPLDFIRLILEAIPMWGHDDAALNDYFYMFPFRRGVLEGNANSSRFIDPHECNNTHPQNEPHRTEPENNDAPCHGELGNNGNCGTTTSSIDYFISCQTWGTGNGQSTREKCVGHIECLNGAGRLNGTSNTTRFVNCTSTGGATTMVVGIDDMGRAFVKCGAADTMTLDCP